MGNPIPRRHGDVDTEAPKKYGANFADQQYFKRRFAEGASVEDVSRETNIRMDCVVKFHPDYRKDAAVLQPAPEVMPKVKVEKPKPIEVVLESPLAELQEDDLDDSDDVSSDDGEPEEGAASPTKRRRRR